MGIGPAHCINIEAEAPEMNKLILIAPMLMLVANLVSSYAAA